jgi:DNA-binding response OmpR family regulator
MKKILLVEDDPFISDIYVTSLGRSNFEVTHCKDGDECINTLKDNKFDLVLLDLLLPKSDGFEVLKKIKENPINTPIIVFTNLTDRETIEKAMSLGATDCLIKSNFKPQEIIEKINKLLA